MTKYLAILAALSFPLLVPQETHAQQVPPCADCYSAEAAREDLRVLYLRLQEEHVDLYARRSKADYDGHIQTLLDAIESPVPRADFHLILHNAIAFGKVGHAKTEIAMTDVFAHIEYGGTIIPLSVSYRGADMYTDHWTGDGDALPPGSRITALGGVPLDEVEAYAARLISADTPRLLRAQIELGLPAYLYLIFGAQDSLQVDYVTRDGVTATHEVTAMELADMYAMQAARPLPAPARNPEARLHRDLGDGVYYIQPGPFFALDAERGAEGEAYRIEPFRAFVEEAFTALDQSGASDLVIDLRSNGGGDTSFSDLIVARLADQPYRFASRYEVRAGPTTKAEWIGRDSSEDTLSGRIAKALETAPLGETVTIDLPATQPIADLAFGGRVWVLVDRHSYSNAAVVAALMQDLGMATIVGEETADLPTTYGAVEEFLLPNSGATILYPKAYMVRPSGSEAVRGVVPDFLIAPNAVLATTDTMLDTAKAQIVLSR